MDGPVNCISALLDAFTIGSTCASPWQPGPTAAGEDDFVQGTLTVTMLSTDLLCELPEIPEVRIHI
jgi:hypothetical protein